MARPIMTTVWVLAILLLQTWSLVLASPQGLISIAVQSTVGLNDPGAVGNTIAPSTATQALPVEATLTISSPAVTQSSAATANATPLSSPSASASEASTQAAAAGTDGNGATPSQGQGSPGAASSAAAGGAAAAPSASSSGTVSQSNPGVVAGGSNITTANATASMEPAAPLSTQIPKLNYTLDQVPFLLQRPLTGVNNTVSPQTHQLQTADAYFRGCGVANNQFVPTDQRINVSAVYTHFDVQGNGNKDPSIGYLKIVAIGAVDSQVTAVADGSSVVSSMSSKTRFVTFTVGNQLESICDRLYPQRADPLHNLTGLYKSCTYGPGQVAFGVSIPLNGSYAWGSLSTQIRLVDSSTPARTISCIEVEVSPYYPSKWYWDLLLWLPIALFLGYFFLASGARMVTAITLRKLAYKNKARPGGAPTFFKDQLNPTVLAALSAEPVIRSPALLRFVTPSCWDVIAYLQFVSLLGMIAVQWPEFVYPVLKQASWANLIANVTLTQPNGKRDLWDPAQGNAVLPNTDIPDLQQQIVENIASPLFIDRSTPNTFLNLNGSRNGLDAYTKMVGLNKLDVFGVATGIWLLIAAALVSVSALVWVFDRTQGAISSAQHRRERLRTSGGLDISEEEQEDHEDGDGYDGHDEHDPANMNEKMGGRRGSQSSSMSSTLTSTLGRWFGHHAQALHGNLVRLLALFHLPLVIFSVYTFTNANIHGIKPAMSSVGLAALSFCILGVFAPAYILWRISRHPTQELYQRKALLLSLGPVYNYYHPGSQLFPVVTFAYSLALGIVIGAAQESGSAQAIIFLALEVFQAIAYILWLPWGDGLMMSPISFTWSMLRVITSVLVLLLAPVVNLSSPARAWITYVILFIQGVALLGLTLLFLAKLIEVFIRLVWKVSFDDRLSHKNGGIAGALRRIRRRKYKSLQVKKGARARSSGATGGRTRSSSTSLNKLMFTHTPGATPMSGSTLPSDGRMRPLSSGQMPYQDGEQDFGVYNAYFRADAMDDGGTIMSAMPSTIQTAGTPTYYGSHGSSPSQGFVRLGGGRATDEQPYQLPVQMNEDAAYRNGAFGRDTTGTPQQLNPLNFASASDGFESQKKRRRGIFRRRRQGVSSEDDTSDDDLAGWGADGQPKVRRWAGVTQISAAFQGLKSRMKGDRESEYHDAPQQAPDAELPTGTGGFSVIRPPKNNGVPLARTTKATSEAGTMTAQEPAAEEVGGSSRPQSGTHVQLPGTTNASAISSLASPTRGQGQDLQRGLTVRSHVYAPTDSSHGTNEVDAAERERAFWMTPETAAAKRKAQPHIQSRQQPTAAPTTAFTGNRRVTSSTSDSSSHYQDASQSSEPRSAADMYASPSSAQVGTSAKASQTSLLKHAKAHSAEILTE